MHSFMGNSAKAIALAFGLIAALAASCRQEPDPDFIQRIEHLTRAQSDDDVVRAIASIVRYAKEHGIEYGYAMRIKGTDKVVLPGELQNHLDDDIEVTIQVGHREPYTEMKWNPPANWYITRLVMP